MAKPCTKSRYRFILERLARCAVMLPTISWPFLVNRTSQSWKPKRSVVMSCPAVCLVARLFSIGLSDTHRSAVNQQICIPNSRQLVGLPAEDFLVVTARKAKRRECEIQISLISERG